MTALTGVVQQIKVGTALQSQVDSATAHELDARTLLLQSQLGHIEAEDEMTEAMGIAPVG